jgi:hypothetical protein
MSMMAGDMPGPVAPCASGMVCPAGRWRLLILPAWDSPSTTGAAQRWCDARTPDPPTGLIALDDAFAPLGKAGIAMSPECGRSSSFVVSVPGGRRSRFRCV